MKYFEFFGMPGSGKTYLTESLSKNTDKISKNVFFIYFKKRTCFSLLKKITFIIVSFPIIIFENNFYEIISFFTFKYKPVNSNFISIRTLSILFNSLFLLSLVRFAKLLRVDVLVVDQGFFQLLWSLLYEINYKNKVKYDFILNIWDQIMSEINVEHNILNCNFSNKLIRKRIRNRIGSSIIEKNSKPINFSKINFIFEYILNSFSYDKKNKGNYIIKNINSEYPEIIDLIMLIEGR